MLKIKAQRAHIEHCAMYGEMLVTIEADESEILAAVLKQFHPLEILDAMTQQQKQDLTDTLFEQFAVGEHA